MISLHIEYFGPACLFGEVGLPKKITGTQKAPRADGGMAGRFLRLIYMESIG